MNTRPRVFVTGATGYIGGRLVTELLAAGCPVRCLARSPEKLARHPWYDDPNVEIVRGDLASLSASDLAELMRGCGPSYYLVHSMVAAGSAYAAADRDMARLFAWAASMAGITRIIYLGGLGELGPDLSEHLTSRREVEDQLASTPVPVTVLRAAMIIGSGSASFEILRYLVERLPIMITPKWVRTECQPIAVRNVLAYLVRCLEEPATIGRTIDIGGPDIMSYHRIMRIMAEELGLRRRLVFPVPFLTPRLSSLWIHLITPISHRLARPLSSGLRNRVVCRNDDAQKLMPQKLLGVRESIHAALVRVEQSDVDTSWASAGPIPSDPDWAGGTTFVDRRTIVLPASPEATYRAVIKIGGGNGWYAADWLWRLRGWMDRMVGGPGLRRGRRDPIEVGYGEALDFWRVTGIEPDRRLSLRAEMKLPGEALLEFTIQPMPDVHHGTVSQLVQTARFRPRGLAGLMYWYAVLPFHGIVFSGMLKGVRDAAVALQAALDASEPAPEENGEPLPPAASSRGR